VKGLELRVSPNGRYIITRDGRPFFYLADTAWQLFKRLNHDEVDEYLTNRVAKGFTAIQAYVLRGLQVANLYGHVPLVDRDPTKPNDAFFQNVDYVVDRANELGLLMGLVVTFGEHVKRVKLDEQIFDPRNAFVFGRYLGDRYRHAAVVWYLGGDRKPLEGREVWTAMARGLKEGSQGIHLVSYHGPGDWATPSSSFWFHNEDWLDFNAIQSGHGWAIPNYDFVAHDYNLMPVKPTLDMEARYENHPDVRTNTRKRVDAHQEREAAYWALLAGAAGHGYGCNDIWQFYDEAVTPYWKEYAHSTTWPNTHWRTAMDFAGATGVGLARKLLESLGWYRLVPDQSVIVKGQGEGEDHVAAARAEDGSVVVAYLPFGNPIGIEVGRVSGGRVKSRWYDPRDGSWTHIEEYPSGGVREFVAPSSGEQDDWVLVLEDAAKDLPA
jgi:hypothetical protein